MPATDANPALPAGNITFLFTDIEGSTQLWEQAPEKMMGALALHDEIFEREVSNNHGVVVRPRGEGDSRFAVFEQADNAVSAAVIIQRQYFAESWSTPRPLKVRMALHTGEADLRMGDYYGSAVNRCARLRSIAHGGQTVLSQATREMMGNSLPADVRLQDEGEHRLKDLTRPEHVFQLLITDLTQKFPPLRSLTIIPNNLPVLLTDFIGREKSLAQIRQLFEKTRLLTLVGPGGIGKSRLSIETAANLADHFKHGVFFVPLAPISAAESIPQAIAEVIGLSLSSHEEPQQQLLNYLHSKQQLLVIDNFEHLIEGAGLLDKILRGSPEVKILATSRTKLNLNGEIIYPVRGLSVNGLSGQETYFENEAVQLFLATAQRARPDFEFSQSDLPSLQKILTLVQGSPLGILLAASWVDVLPVSEIAAEISQSLDFLETEMGNVPERQRSIRAAFDYSWRLLAQSEREMFAALSVFRGGFTRQAAQRIAGASLRHLSNLANKSLLSTNPDSGRYFVHELLRQYGEEALREDGDRYASTRVAHDRYYASFMNEAWLRVTGDEQAEALRDIEADIENIRRAWRHLVSQGDPDIAQKIVPSMWSIHEIRGWYISAEEIFSEASRFAQHRPQSDALKILVALSEVARSWFVALLGRPDEGVVLAERSIKTLRALGATTELAFAYSVTFMSLFLSAQPARMRQIGQESIEMSDDSWINYNAHAWLSYAARMEGNESELKANLGLLEGLKASKNYWQIYWWQLSKAMTALDHKDFAQGREILENLLPITKTIDMKRGLHHVLYNLGIVARALEDYDSAEKYLLQSILLSEELGRTIDRVSALVDLALTLVATGEIQHSLELAATAFAHPLSDQVTIWDTNPVQNRALALRSSIEGTIPPESVKAAWQRGLVADFDQVIANLMEQSPTM